MQLSEQTLLPILKRLGLPTDLQWDPEGTDVVILGPNIRIYDEFVHPEGTEYSFSAYSDYWDFTPSYNCFYLEEGLELMASKIRELRDEASKWISF